MERKRIRTRENAPTAAEPRRSRPSEAGMGGGGGGTDGFSLSFVGGRGILSLRNCSLSESIQAELLELIIAELTFPFDITGGIRGLRHRRHRLGRLRLTITLDELSELVARRVKDSTWSDVPTISFEKDHIAVLVKYGPEQTRIPVSFRLLPRVRENSFDLFVDEPRTYGPLPVSPLLVAVASIQEMTEIRPKGLTVTLPEPIHLALFHLLPVRGWRIPDYSRARLSRLDLMPDRILLEFCDVDLLEDAAANPFGLSDEEQFQKLKKAEENRVVADGDTLLTDGQVAAARSAYGKLLTRDPENPIIVGRLATIDITTPELMGTAHSQVDQAWSQYPERTDLASILCHGAALAKNIEAEIDAHQILLKNANSLERYASGLRVGNLLLDTDPEGACAAFKKSLAARREDLPAITALLMAQTHLSNRDAALQLIPRFIAAHKHAADRTAAYIQAGRILLDKLSLPKEAVRHFERAAMSDPHNLSAQWGLAESLAGAGELQRAVAQFERLERSCRRQGNMKGAGKALSEIGKIWLDRGEPTLAIQRLREALDFDKEAHEVRITLGGAYAKIKRMADAAREYETALGHAGGERRAAWFGQAALELAKIYLNHLDDSDGAEIWAKTASEFETLQEQAQELLVIIWEGQGKHASLISHLEAKIRKEPSFQDTLKLVSTLREQGDRDECYQVLERALGFFPEQPEILDALIEFSRELGQHGRLREALVARANTLESGDRKRAMEIELGGLELREFSDPKAAINWYKLAAANDPNCTEAVQGIAVAIDTLGKSARRLLSSEEYEKARELFSFARRECDKADEPELAVGEAEAALKLGDVEGALRAAMTAQEGSLEHRGQAAHIAARAFMEIEAPDEAVRQLELAAEAVDPMEAATLYFAAGEICQENLGDNSHALRLYERVVSIDPSHRAANKNLRQLMIELNDCEGLAEHIIASPTTRDEGPRMQQAAQLFLAAGQPARAAEILEQLLKKSGDIEDTRALARALKETGRVDDLMTLVRNQAKRDNEVDPQLIDELEIVADLLESRSEVEAAAAITAELSRLSDPDGSRSARAARLALSVGQIKSARRLMTNATSKQPKPEWILRLARLLHPTEDREVMGRLEKLLEDRAEPPSVNHKLGFLEILVEHNLAANREDEAVSRLSDMISLAPTNPAIWQRLVSVLERRGKWEKLAVEMQNRLELLESPEDIAEMNFEMGQLLETKLGDEFGAQKCYDRVLKIDPNHEGALRSSCHLAFQRQKWTRLDNLLGRIQVTEHDPILELWRASAAERMGRKQEAASLYKLLINQDPENTLAAEGLARVEPDSSLEGKLSDAFDRLRQK